LKDGMDVLNRRFGYLMPANKDTIPTLQDAALREEFLGAQQFGAAFAVLGLGFALWSAADILNDEEQVKQCVTDEQLTSFNEQVEKLKGQYGAWLNALLDELAPAGNRQDGVALFRDFHGIKSKVSRLQTNILGHLARIEVLQAKCYRKCTVAKVGTLCSLVAVGSGLRLLTFVALTGVGSVPLAGLTVFVQVGTLVVTVASERKSCKNGKMLDRVIRKLKSDSIYLENASKQMDDLEALVKQISFMGNDPREVREQIRRVVAQPDDAQP